jgi:hypothetical protein
VIAQVIGILAGNVCEGCVLQPLLAKDAAHVCVQARDPLGKRSFAAVCTDDCYAKKADAQGISQFFLLCKRREWQLGAYSVENSLLRLQIFKKQKTVLQ